MSFKIFKTSQPIFLQIRLTEYLIKTNGKNVMTGPLTLFMENLDKNYQALTNLQGSSSSQSFLSQTKQTAINYLYQLDLLLSDVESTEVDQVLTFYMMLAPLNMTEEDISVVLLSDEGKTYKGKMLSKILQAGYSYDFPVVLEESIEDNLSVEDIKAPGMGDTEIEI